MTDKCDDWDFSRKKTLTLNSLPPPALKAAMIGGMDGWARWGSASDHVRYAEAIGKTRNWRKCPCGCTRRSTHRGMANGMCLMHGCELRVARWVKGT